MSPSVTRLARVAVPAAAFVVALTVAATLVRPHDGGPAGTDAAASVVYFEHIVGGRRLEAFVNTTPKPLITLVYGGLRSMTGGWEAAAWLTVAVLASAVVMGAELARRLAGREAAVFAFVAMLGSTAILAEAAWGQGLPWALAMWFAAGLALVRPAPRFGLAGVFLLLAALARPETFVILALATAWLGWRFLRGPRPPARAGLLLIGWLAILVLGLHDLLLTGDPLWWTKVAAIGTEGRTRSRLGGAVRLNIAHLTSYLRLLPFAVIGVIVLIRARSWVVVWSLVALGPLVVATTLLLAARRLAVLGHYLHPVDVTVILAGAVGVAAVLGWVGRRVTARASGRVRGLLPVAMIAAAAVLAVVLPAGFAPLDARARRTIGIEADAALRINAAIPMLRQALGTAARPDAVSPGPYKRPNPEDVILFPPRYQTNRLAAELGIPMSQIRWLEADRLDLAGGYPPAGSIVYTDGRLTPQTTYAATEALRPASVATLDGVRVVPLVADPDREIWIARIDAAQAAPSP